MASSFEIERGIPLPVARCIYPFANMQIGDSFKVSKSDQKKLSVSMSAFKRKTGAKLVMRAEGDGYRVWRVA